MAAKKEAKEKAPQNEEAKDAATQQAESDAVESEQGDGSKQGDGSEQGDGRAESDDALSIEIPESLPLEVAFRTYQSDQYTHEELGLSEEQVMEMYRDMLLQRRFEERCAQMYMKQKISGFLHLYIGQEAVSTGATRAIEVGKDTVITAYRDHGLGLAMGLTANECMAELFGKKTGCSEGKGGSMHFFDHEKRLFGGHGIVGSHIPVGVGIAFAHKYKEDGRICLCFFGDGAVQQGSFHEACNLAALYELPVVLICENNQYGMGTSIERAAAEPDLYKQAVSYDMPGALVNGMDVFTVYKAIQDHAEMARQNQPSLLEIRTYRYQGHSISDPAKYRTREELERKKNDDGIIRLKQYVLNHDFASEDELDALDDEIKQEVMDAIQFADESDFPPLEDLYKGVYTQDDYPFIN